MAVFIRMDYPNDKENNINYDGKSHDILPLKLQKILVNGCELFLLNYCDFSLGRKSMITLLVREKGNFYKVPLIKYDISFDELVEIFASKGRDVKLNILSTHIGTKVPTDLLIFLQQLMNSKVAVQSKKEKIIYFDSSTEKYYWDKECISEIKGAPDSLGKKIGNKIYGNDDTDYVIEVLERVAMKIPIYYNEADGNYYDDSDCRRLISDTSRFPKNPKEGDKIHAGANYFYIVHIVNVRRDYLDFDNPTNNPYDDIQADYGVSIYYNESDGKFYSDKECKFSLESDTIIIQYRIMYSDRKPQEGELLGNYTVHLVFVKKDDYVRTERIFGIQDIYYDDMTNCFYFDKEFIRKVERIPELDMYLFLNRIPREGEIIFGNNKQTKFIIHRDDKNKFIQPIYYDLNTNNYYSDLECSKKLNNILQLNIYQLAHPMPENGDLIQVSENLSLRINVVSKNKSK